MPEKIEQSIRNPEKQTLLKKLCIIPNSFENVQVLRLDCSTKLALLEQEGLVNQSAYNIVFELSDHKIKSGGLSNRLQSMLITKGIWPGQWGATPSGDLVIIQNNNVKRLTDVLPKKIETYQTASRFRNYLLCRECIDQQKLKTVDVPTTYLYVFDQAKKPHDENCVVIQEKTDATTCETQKMTIEHVRELFALIERVGLWTLNDLLQKDGTIYIVDLEQPNNAHPDHCFERDDFEYQGNVKSGIEQLINLCKHDPKKMALIVQLIKSSKHIDHFADRWKREMSLLLQHIK
ncbi:MAG: hypothetical protein WD055_03290 [Candidatus Dependentiae bacterium]